MTAHDFIAAKNVPTVLAAVLDKSAPKGTLEALLARFETRKARRARKSTTPMPAPSTPTKRAVKRSTPKRTTKPVQRVKHEPSTPVTVTLVESESTERGSARPVTISELNRLVATIGKPKPVHHGAPKPVFDPLAATQTPVRAA